MNQADTDLKRDVMNHIVVSVPNNSYDSVSRDLPEGIVTLLDGDTLLVGTHEAFQRELYIRHSIFRLYIADQLKRKTFEKYLSAMYTVSFDNTRSNELVCISRLGHLVIFQSNGKAIDAKLKPEYKKYTELIEHAFNR